MADEDDNRDITMSMVRVDVGEPGKNASELFNENWDLEWMEDNSLPPKTVVNPQVKIQDIPKLCTREALREACEEIAAVLDFRLLPNRDSESDPDAKQHAYITFDSAASAFKAVKQLRQLTFGERSLRVSLAQSKQQYEQTRLERIKENELLRECGYTNVVDDPHLRNLIRCGNCGRDERRQNVRFCTGCRNVAYCNKECQKVKWILHQRECTSMVEKRKALKAEQKMKKVKEEVERNLRAKRIPFKSLPLNIAVNCLVAHAANPSDLAVRPKKKDFDEEAAEYYVLSSFLQMYGSNVNSGGDVGVEDVAVGDVVVAKLREGVEEEKIEQSSPEQKTEKEMTGVPKGRNMNNDVSFHRAIVTKSHQTEVSKVVDIWFCDLGVTSTSVSLGELLSYAAFEGFLKSNDGSSELTKLPTRLVRCRLCSSAEETGKSVLIRPLNGNHDDPESEADVLDWHPGAIAFVKRLVHLEAPLEVLAIEESDDILPIYSVILQKNDVSVGDALVDVDLAKYAE